MKRANAGNTDDDPTEEERLAAEEGRWYDEHRDELELGPRVNVRVAKNVKHVFSFKIEADELDELAEAAEAEGISVSKFVRDAALAVARKTKRPEVVDDVRRKLNELTETVNRL